MDLADDARVVDQRDDIRGLQDVVALDRSIKLRTRTPDLACSKMCPSVNRHGAMAM